MGSKISNISRSNIFSDISPWARETIEKNKQMGLHQTNKFCTAKETTNKTKRHPTGWENILTNDISDKRLISKIYKELIQLNTTKTNNPILENGQKT